MEIPARIAISALRGELARLRTSQSRDKAGLEAVDLVLDLLDRHHAEHGRNARLRLAALRQLWTQITSVTAGTPLAGFEIGLTQAEQTDAAVRGLVEQSETAFARFLEDNGISMTRRHEIARLVVAWEAQQPSSITSHSPSASSIAARPIDRGSLENYLRNRVGDPGIGVSRFDELPGGFGKRTFFFVATGQALNGEFVLRAEHGSASLFAKDCHVLANEHRLLQMLNEAGYPSPQPVLSDDASNALTGCDLMIMRRADGVSGGDHLASGGRPSEELVRQLAQLAARLHGMTPPIVLDVPGTMISADLRGVTRTEAITRNIAGWRAYFRTAPHAPSPALMALFDLLLRSVPESNAPPVLLHGDFGLHNLLVSDERITAVIDWEAAHLGDPAEDVAYTLRALGGGIAGERFLVHYYAAGGQDIDPARLRYFDLVAQVRGAVISNLVGERFAHGDVHALKLCVPGIVYVTHFLRLAFETLETFRNGHTER